MSNNYGEKELTKFFNDEFFEILAPKLRQFGFPIAGREKRLYGKEFDLWFHKKAVGFVIIETEMVGWHDHYNVEKLKEIGILRWKWRPRVVLFQIFSPFYKKGKGRIEEKNYCVKLGKRLRRRHRNFWYYPIDMEIDRERFERMVDYFQKSRYAAKQYYGHQLRREMRRLGREITENVKQVFEIPKG